MLFYYVVIIFEMNLSHPFFEASTYRNHSEHYFPCTHNTYNRTSSMVRQSLIGNILGTTHMILTYVCLHSIFYSEKMEKSNEELVLYGTYSFIAKYYILLTTYKRLYKQKIKPSFPCFVLLMFDIQLCFDVFSSKIVIEKLMFYVPSTNLKIKIKIIVSLYKNK